MSDEARVEEKPSAFVSIEKRQILYIGLVGLGVGVLVWGLSFLLETYVFKAILCQGSNAAQCAAPGPYAQAMAAILAAGVGLFGLVKLRVFRPLLVVLAATLSLWGMLVLFAGSPWYVIGAATALLYGISYLTFAWLVRIRLFWLAALLILVVVVIVRLILMR